MSAAPAPAQVKNGSLPQWVQQLVMAAAMAAVGWAIATGQASAVQEQRLATVEAAVDKKASKESVDDFKREVISRLDRIENKIDRAERRK
jgi:hypothetical protein